MEVLRLQIPDVRLVRPVRRADSRGFFTELYKAPDMAAAGVSETYLQDNLSYSAKAGTVRGLHYQAPPHAQAKLVGVITGAVRDVAVDVRRGSPTYGRHVTADLDAETGWQIHVPAGFLHGFVTLTDDVRVLYKVSDVYAPACEGSVCWDDPDLAVDWGLEGRVALLSDKDAAAPAFADFVSPFAYQRETAA